MLDENVDPALGTVLIALGHEADHVTGLGHRGSSDEQLVQVATEYDIFVTLDLHRQEAEWLAVNRALVEGGIKVLRIRLPDATSNVMLDLVRSLTYRMDVWLAEFAAGKVLVTLRHVGTIFSARGQDEVSKMMQEKTS